MTLAVAVLLAVAAGVLVWVVAVLVVIVATISGTRVCCRERKGESHFTIIIVDY